MRVLIVLPILLAVGCSGGGDEPTANQAQSTAPAAGPIRAGQWQIDHEVVSLTKRDQGTPKIDMPAGTKSTTSLCVAEADVQKPQPALFLTEGYDCTYRDSYVSGGRINANFACRRDGLQGDISVVVNANSTAETLKGTAVTETRLVTDGDVRVETNFSGRRTGECVAGAEDSTAK